MGILFSKQPKVVQTKLITTIYCNRCKQVLLFNEYYKHFRECKLNKKNNNL